MKGKGLVGVLLAPMVLVLTLAVAGGSGAVPTPIIPASCSTTYQPGSSTTIPPTAIAAAAYAGGFRANDEVIAVAVGLAESGGNIIATHLNTNGTTDYGLWQINSVHAALLASGSWSDPIANARMAFSIQHDAGGWTPWSTFNSGAYLDHMAEATAAVTTDAPACVTPASFDTLGNKSTAAQAVAWAQAKALNDPTTPQSGMCDMMTAVAYGWTASGINTAYLHWQAIPDNLKQPGGTDPPPGALVAWTTHHAAGHIALSVGNGYVATTDYRGNGSYSIESIASITTWTGGALLGWAAPWFPINH